MIYINQTRKVEIQEEYIYFFLTKPNINDYCPAQNVIAITDRRKSGIFTYEWWRLWTYQFAHIGIGHLLSNVIYQIIFGSLLEAIQGPLRVGTLYTVGVVFGGCFSIIMKENWSKTLLRKRLTVSLIICDSQS